MPYPISSLNPKGDKEMVPSEVDREVEPNVTGLALTSTCPNSSSRHGVVNVDFDGAVIIPESLPSGSNQECFPSDGRPSLFLQFGGDEVPLVQGDFLQGLEEFRRLQLVDRMKTWEEDFFRVSFV